jgi:hypothetical protein
MIVEILSLHNLTALAHFNVPAQVCRWAALSECEQGELDILLRLRLCVRSVRVYGLRPASKFLCLWCAMYQELRGVKTFPMVVLPHAILPTP